MRHAIVLAAALVAMLAATGCVHAIGRCVTNVGAASAGQLQVEKCTLKFNSFTATYSTEECQTVLIQVMQPGMPQQGQ